MEEQIIVGRPPMTGYGTNIISGLGLPAYNYAGLTTDTTTDTWVFKTGGASGQTVATVVIAYTDASKATISSVLKS